VEDHLEVEAHLEEAEPEEEEAVVEEEEEEEEDLVEVGFLPNPSRYTEAWSVSEIKRAR
jgi:hypothetical protein